MVCRLKILQPLFQLGVGGEIDCLVGTLAEGSEGHAAVEGADAFFFQNGEESVHGIAVLGNVEGVGEGVVLGL